MVIRGLEEIGTSLQIVFGSSRWNKSCTRKVLLISKWVKFTAKILQSNAITVWKASHFKSLLTAVLSPHHVLLFSQLLSVPCYSELETNNRHWILSLNPKTDTVANMHHY